MPYLYDTVPFEAGSRLTGVWTVPPECDDLEALALISLVTLGRDQDPHLESDFLTAHLPYAIGGIHGVDPYGTPWALMVQVMPETAAQIVPTACASWPTADAINRVLTLNDQAALDWDRPLDRSHLLQAYHERGVSQDQLEDWTLADLLVGLLTECCYDDLPDIVALAPSGCPFPDDEHECQHDTFRDVFAMWSSGALNPPEPEDDDEDEESSIRATARRIAIKKIPETLRPRSTYTRTWKKSKLRTWKTSRLRLVAVEQGWSAKKASKMNRKTLIRALSTRRVRSAPRLLIADKGPKGR